MKKAVAYARFSSDNQRQESIDAQVRAINEYCEKNKLTLLRIYQDEAQSATSDQRDHFLQMIEDAEKHEFDFVVVHKLDRFARNRYDSAFYKRELRQHGVKLLSVLENLDDSPESVILESVLEGMAEYYSKNLAREVRKGQKENALKAIHNGGIPPLGYDVLNGKYVINEVEAQAVRFIFQWYVEGLGYGKIVDKLNELGFKTKVGKPFGKNSIYDILRNEKYIGVYTFNRRESKKTGNRKYKSVDQIVRVENAIPRIITQDIWDATMKATQLRVRVRITDTREYLLKGYITCGDCGGKYVGYGYTNKKCEHNYTYQCAQRKRSGTCSNKPVYASSLEAFIIDYIVGNIMNDEFVSSIARDFNEVISQKQLDNSKERKQLEKQVALMKVKESKLWDLYYADQLNKDIFSVEMNRLTDEIKSINELIASLDKAFVTTGFDESEVISFIVNLKDMYLNDTEASKKLLIEAFLKEIIVYPDRFDINFKVLPESKSAKQSGKTVYPEQES